MTGLVFVDTNIFIYTFDQAVAVKQQAANRWLKELWHGRRGRISFQVLQEFYAKVSQRWPEARGQVREKVRDLLDWGPVTINRELIERSWAVQDRYRLSFWDALIVAAAKSASCRYLLTEDLQAGQELDGVLVVNPFLADPGSLPEA